MAITIKIQEYKKDLTECKGGSLIDIVLKRVHSKVVALWRDLNGEKAF